MNFIHSSEFEAMFDPEFVVGLTPGCLYLCTDCGQCACCHTADNYGMLDWGDKDILSSPDIVPCHEVVRRSAVCENVLELLSRIGYKTNGLPPAFLVSALF